MRVILLGVCAYFVILCGHGFAQDAAAETETAAPTTVETASDTVTEESVGTDPDDSESLATSDGATQAPAAASEGGSDEETPGGGEGFTESIDQNETVQQASARILRPLERAAEVIVFPGSYWIAFALMTAGVISFAFQLVIGKVVVLVKGSLSLTEIISDAVGLMISATGLVLTTQLAADNSGFTQSPTAILSATAVGVIMGLLLYRWGQAQEVAAARGRKSTE